MNVPEPSEASLRVFRVEDSISKPNTTTVYCVDPASLVNSISTVMILTRSVPLARDASLGEVLKNGRLQLAIAASPAKVFGGLFSAFCSPSQPFHGQLQRRAGRLANLWLSFPVDRGRGPEHE